MRLLSRLLGAYLFRRLLTGAPRRRRSTPPPRYGARRWSAPPPRYAARRRGRMRMVGPFPTYSTRTRRGSRVTVSGCCLPIPLTLAAGAALGARAALRR
jgi:hypothetical protein